MTKAECQIETIKHIEKVREYITLFVSKLLLRAMGHDNTKLHSPEVEIFTEYTPKLATSTYGSDEYKMFLQEMKSALQHHYAANRHHPEHFENGVNDMTLIDIVEMFCDWKAASQRHIDGNILKSIDINAKRFGIDDQFKQILVNTAKLFDEQDEHTDV